MSHAGPCCLARCCGDSGSSGGDNGNGGGDGGSGGGGRSGGKRVDDVLNGCGGRW